MTNLIRIHWKYWTPRSCYWYDYNKAILIHIDRLESNTENLAHPDFRLRHNTMSTRWVYGMLLFYPYLIARLWVSHCNTIYHTEYAMNAKTQQQAVVCMWAWISNKKNTLNKYKRWNSWSYASINSLWPNDAIWRPRSGSELVYVMARLPGGTKPLAKPIDELTHWHLRSLIKIWNELFLKPILMIDCLATCCEIALRRMSLDITNDTSTLV